MKWNSASTPPKHSHEVLVTDGEGSFTVAWWYNGHWMASDDMLTTDGYDTDIYISEPVTEWTEINHPKILK